MVVEIVALVCALLGLMPAIHDSLYLHGLVSPGPLKKAL